MWVVEFWRYQLVWFLWFLELDGWKGSLMVAARLEFSTIDRHVHGQKKKKKIVPMTLVLQTEGVPVHAHCCSALGAWCLFTKPDQTDWLYLLYDMHGDLQWSDLCRTHAPCPGDSWLMSSLSVQIIGLVNCRRLNEKLVCCLSSLCAPGMLLSVCANCLEPCHTTIQSQLPLLQQLG